MAENVYCLAQALMQKDQVIKDIGRKLQPKNECAEALRRSLSRSLVDWNPCHLSDAIRSHTQELEMQWSNSQKELLRAEASARAKLDYVNRQAERLKA